MCLNDAEMGNMEENNSKHKGNLDRESMVMSSDHQSTVLDSFQVSIQSILCSLMAWLCWVGIKFGTF